GYVLTGSDDGTLKLWDIATARLVRTFAGHKGSVTAVELSADGTRVLTGSEDKTIRLWEIATGRLIRTSYAHLDAGNVGNGVSSVALSPDGRRLLSCSAGEGAAKLWDAETGRLVRVFRHAKGAIYNGVTSAVFSPDGTRLATGGGGGGGGGKIVNLWDTETGQLVQAFGEYSPTFMYRVKLAFSPDGARILVGDNKTLKVWNTAKGTLIYILSSDGLGAGQSGLGSMGPAIVAF